MINPIKMQRRRSSLALGGQTRRSSLVGNEAETLPSAGTMEILTMNVENQSTFLDHIKNGLQLSVTIAIDFTGSLVTFV